MSILLVPQKRKHADGKRYYKILEVPVEASLVEIKETFRRLMKKIHPDKLGGAPVDVIEAVKEQAQLLNEAYKARRIEMRTT